VRPLPHHCAVGSYVELCKDAAVEVFATTIIKTLGFSFGVAEVEIVRLQGGQLAVIEVNPRPWTQFSLSYRSGRDFLGFLLDLPPRPNARRPTERLSWIDLTNDFYVCFGRGQGLLRTGDLTPAQYLCSLLRARAYSRFALNDPYPEIRVVFGLLGRLLPRLWRNS